MTGECRSDYMGERLLGQEVGGSIPPLGNRVAQNARSDHSLSPGNGYRGECRWDYTDLRVAGSSPAGPSGT